MISPDSKGRPVDDPTNLPVKPEVLLNVIAHSNTPKVKQARGQQSSAHKWPWVNTNYHQNWVGEHPNKDYYIQFWDVHQGYRVLTNSQIEQQVGHLDILYQKLLEDTAFLSHPFTS